MNYQKYSLQKLKREMLDDNLNLFGDFLKIFDRG